MKTGTMYEIIRDGKNGVIAPFGEPLPTDIVAGTKIMLVADDRKTLLKDGVDVGQCVLLRDGDTQENYEERDIPPEPEDENAIVE